ncbi:AMP-binding protein [Branchiibius hedensis]|uniref:AMP-binding protein n=1 Tax=Branchiibius hedensis TaxID=672460 RepID=UPI000D6C3D2D|nr:AMP-binding protein [Branchiibius hedensis]
MPQGIRVLPRPDSVGPALGLPGPDSRTLSYDELRSQIATTSAALITSGVPEGSVIGLGIANRLEFVLGLLGAANAGAVVAVIDPGLAVDDIRARLHDAGAVAWLTTSDGPEVDTLPRW